MNKCVDSTRVVLPLFQTEDGGSIPTSTLQLTVYECSVRKAQDLNRQWHSILPDTNSGNLLRNKASVFYAAQAAGIYYAVAIWTTPIAANRLKDGFDSLELRRFAIASDAPPNTASRMLAVMVRMIRKKFPWVRRLISYQAEEHHSGTIYKAAGWTPADRSVYSVWHKGKARNAPQTKSAKIRWEKLLWEHHKDIPA